MESLKQQIPIGEITHTVKLHYRPGVLNAMRVSWDGRILGIVGVTADPRKRFLTLNCKEAV
jgi:SPP1 family predicted phage head-tail adaptor